jgi:type II secretory pathway pseudopilin PulG
LQQTPNLSPQQQNVLQQLTHQFKLMQQHQQQLRLQQAQLRGGGLPIRGQQQLPQAQQFQQQNQTNFPSQQQQQQQPIGNRTPQSGTTAQTGFMNDGSFSPATGHSQAGMPFKSAGGFQQQQITSTTSNQDLSKFKLKYENCCERLLKGKSLIGSVVKGKVRNVLITSQFDSTPSHSLVLELYFS